MLLVVLMIRHVPAHRVLLKHLNLYFGKVVVYMHTCMKGYMGNVYDIFVVHMCILGYSCMYFFLAFALFGSISEGCSCGKM